MSKTMAMKAYEVMGKEGLEKFLLSLKRHQYEDVSEDCEYVLYADMFDPKAVYMAVGFDKREVLTVSVFSDFDNFEMHKLDAGNSDFEFLCIGRGTLTAKDLPIGTSYIQKNDVGEVIATGFKFGDIDWRKAGSSVPVYNSQIDHMINGKNDGKSIIFLNSDGKEINL